MNNEPVYASVRREAFEKFEAYCVEHGIDFTPREGDESTYTYECQMTPEQMREACEEAIESVFLYHASNGVNDESYSEGSTMPSYGEMLAAVEKLQKKIETFEPTFNDFKSDFEDRMKVFENHLNKLLGIETLCDKE